MPPLDRLWDEFDYKGPQAFSRRRIGLEPNLFVHRGALMYTPTENLPSEFIGSGPLDVVLPVVPPTYWDCMHTWGHQVPRLWVDLLQRATGKIRWRPNSPATVTYVRSDSYVLPSIIVMAGYKSLTDALKVKTTGRRDGRSLYYFGAIEDDNDKALTNVEFKQELVDHPSKACCRVIVQTSRLERSAK